MFKKIWNISSSILTAQKFKQLSTLPSKSFVRRIPETMEKVVEYKNDKKIVQASEVFDLEDKRMYVKRLKTQYILSKKYTEISNKWKNHIIWKKKKKERVLERKAIMKRVEPQETKLIMHSPSLSEINVNDFLKSNSFAVIALNGKQYKVCQDDLLIINALRNYDVGEVLESDKVLLVGNKYFTLMGRPLVKECRVIMCVESQTKGRKVIVFKKKRRKGYRRSHGHRSLQTFLRVQKIEYDVDEDLAKRAVGVWSSPLVHYD